VNSQQPAVPSWRTREGGYAAALFALALGVLGVATYRSEAAAWMAASPVALLFFVLFGVFTIVTGYRQANVGHVSFDRVAQVAAILVLGPLPAAWVNGCASLLFPWIRWFRGQPWENALVPSLHNAGLMALMTWLSGSIYLAVGGQVPLLALQLGDVIALLALLVAMQMINDLMMWVEGRVATGQAAWPFNAFVIGVEGAAGLCAIFVAMVMNRMELPVVLLMLTVFGIGMVVLTQFARMRNRLEEIVSERTQRLREQATELERQATHDQLTGLFNRRFAERFLAEGIADFSTQRRHFSIALVDLDHFKLINDNFNHEVGDAVLTRVSALLRDNCRSVDMVARFGGEEFLIGFPNTDLANAARACEHIRDAVETTDWSDIAPGLAVTLCIGVAQMHPGYDRSRLLRTADERLYRGKSAGRNRVMAESVA